MSDEARPGTYADLSRRVERLEETVGSLSGSVSRVEITVEHVRQLSELRFNALESGMKAIDGKLDTFMRRIEGMISGEVQTVQTREAEARIKDYEEWRAGVDITLTQVRFLGRLIVLSVTGNFLAIVAAFYALVK